MLLSHAAHDLKALASTLQAVGLASQDACKIACCETIMKSVCAYLLVFWINVHWQAANVDGLHILPQALLWAAQAQQGSSARGKHNHRKCVARAIPSALHALLLAA